MATTEEMLAEILAELKAQGAAAAICNERSVAALQEAIEVGKRNVEIGAKNADSNAHYSELSEVRAKELHVANMAQLARNRVDWERNEEQRKKWDREAEERRVQKSA